MSRPTKLTITIMMAASGSRTQPRSTVEEPKRNQVKLTNSRTTAPCAHPATT